MPRKTGNQEYLGNKEMSSKPKTPSRPPTGRKRGRPPASVVAARLAASNDVSAASSIGRPSRERIATPNATIVTRYNRDKDGASPTATTGSPRPVNDAVTPNASSAFSAAVQSEPPPKRRRYIPGGAGGGGRFVEEDGTITPNTTPRTIRQPRQPRVPNTVIPRREKSARIRSAADPGEVQYSTAAAAAAAVAQSEGYKPREERGWEEFHPNLDIDATFMMFRSEDVDGLTQPRPATPAVPSSVDPDSSTPLREVNPSSTGNTPNPAPDAQSGQPETPQKRRSSRPIRDTASQIATREISAITSTPKVPQVLPIRNQTAKEKLDLKAPSYRRSDRVAQFERKSFGQARYVDKSMMNVGYQESDHFLQPAHRLIKADDSNFEDESDMALALALALKGDAENAPAPTTSAPLGRVEYDMDEQDDMWLQAYNVERRKNDLEPITREIFEITITKIEKEWHALEKRIPKPNPKPPQTHRPRSSSAAAVNGEPLIGEEHDSKCAICDDGDCENTNAIVFCDGCDLAVHQECYGVPFIPEGQWLCRRCQLIGRGVPTCIFCPNTDGAFKQTNSSKWAHLLCAMWIPEASLGNHTFMEPVMDVDKVPKTRWKLTCYICNQKMGACIQCGNKSCYQAFHVTCARRSRLFLKMKNSQGALAVLDNSMILKAYCDKHCPPDYTQENNVAEATREAQKFYKKTMKGRIWADSQASAHALAATHRHALTEHPPDASQMTGARLSALLGDKKKGQPIKSIWKLPSGAPVIPQVVFDVVEASISRFTLRKRKDFVSEACRYWTLKREARRGATLLKRLQLQMETFSSMELTRRNFASMGPPGKPRLIRRLEFAKTLIQDLEQLRALSEKVVEREQHKLESAELEKELVDTCYFPITRLFGPIVEKALGLDKNVFYDGLVKLQSKLEERYYTTTLAFAHDLCEVIDVGINTEIKKGDSAVDEAITTIGKVSYQDPRQRKTLGKRILKAVQPQLEAALRIETEINSKPLDPLTKELEGMLEASLEFRQPSIIVGVGEDSVEACRDVAMVDAPAGGEITVASGQADPAAEGVAENTDAMEIDAEGEADEDNIEVATSNLSKPAEQTVEAQSSSSSVAGLESNGKAVENADSGSLPNGVPASSNTPPATNGYQAAPPPVQPTPPTPPQSVGGGLGNHRADPLLEGGIPWYLKDFKLRGTTILADQWPGRDAIRSLSEELSDMDDRELEGLGFDVDDSTITASPNGAAGQAIADTIVSKAKTTTSLVNSRLRKRTRSSARRR
ncbi:hypothetical protein SODALDRAFT_376179 [Sodiomyces alkalinus F11]|uniref:Uncharacterized protein n=1 Tax=Sodiomyces alkalinus (strain CBS 110278 / VKM F-3762 / F11) TaxID=1314773 RepID=A0A3N2Q0V1_SODAK|nr:hypothetical protein SODALDRAFT_376179 [Sodiomyces alkalinus F11]ROT40387.1 hypothetical protein SODALDRAFT_376179 [Sodiomyces alkalinus F11]